MAGIMMIAIQALEQRKEQVAQLESRSGCAATAMVRGYLLSLI